MREARLHARHFVTGAEVRLLLEAIGLPVVFVLLCAYVLLMPEKVEKISGWLWSGVSAVFRRGDRRAVALRVQGHVNSCTRHLLKHMPEGTVEGKLKLRWSTSEEAQSLLRDGEVVVFMQRSRHHEENVAHALMVYLPKAILPRARRYLDGTTMEAVDLTLAKIVLGRSAAERGVLDVLYEQHLDPACEADAELSKKVVEMDEIDLHGWLLRVLLPEYRRLGNQLHPSEPDARSRADADSFARWLHDLAARKPGDVKKPLSYEGSHLRVAIVFVAHWEKLEKQGVEPYRKRAKSLIYSGKYEAVYLMARDRNMWAVKEIVAKLQNDGRVDATSVFEFRLRPDFAKRRLNRVHAIVACITPHGSIPVDQPLDEDLGELDVERFSPPDEVAPKAQPFYTRDPAAALTDAEVEAPSS